MTARIKLGSFELLKPLDRGGMGQVWVGRHIVGTEMVPVVVKVIHGERASDEESREQLLREVKTLARLHHPGIVPIYEVGQVDGVAATSFDESSEEWALQLGSPYYVMQRGEATLDAVPIPGWSELRSAIDTLLRALAYAHAQGVVHQDLKPANVLLPEPGAFGAVMLLDFGLATGGDTTSEASEVVLGGSLPYMAPEQFGADPHAVGPWTDLYALGVLVWELVSGKLPFWAPHPEGYVVAWCYQHAEGRLPELKVRFPDVPEPLQEWLVRCLEPDPRHRFRSAADARLTLDEMLRGTHAMLPMVDSTPSEQDSDEADDDEADDDEAADDEAADDEAAASDAEARRSAGPSGIRRAPQPAPQPAPTPAPELPGRRRAQVSSCLLCQASPPSGYVEDDEPLLEPTPGERVAGPRLFEFRPPPLVGRVEQRELLWALVRGAQEVCRPRIAALEAPSWSGKSRLADWLAFRTRELGGVTVLRKESGAPAGLRDLLSRLIQPDACGLETLLEFHRDSRPDEPLVSWLLETCVQRADPAVLDEQTAISLALFLSDSRDLRLDLALEILGTVAGRRPLLLVFDGLDDEHRDLLALVRALESGPAAQAPIAVLAVVDSEKGQRAWSTTLSDVGATPISLGPLSRQDFVEAFRWVPGLTREQALRLHDRSNGLPGYAVLRIATALEKGKYQHTEDGLELLDWDSELPEKVTELCLEVLQQILVRERPGDPELLLLAAAFGCEVPDEPWRIAAGRMASGDPAALLDALVARYLASLTPVGWRWANSALRDHVYSSATPEARSAAHRACADVFDEMAGEAGHALRGRGAIHRFEAGDRAEAMQTWREVLVALIAGNAGQAASLAKEVHPRVVGELKSDDDLPFELLRLCLLATVRAGAEGVSDTILASLKEHVDRISHPGRKALRRGLVRECEAKQASLRNRRTTALEAAREAQSQYDLADRLLQLDPASPERMIRVARSRHIEAEVLSRSGSRAARLEAAGLLDQASRLAERAGARAVMLDCVLLRGRVRRELGDWDRAVPDLQRALGLARELGRVGEEGAALRELGNVAAGRGEHDDALSWYEDAMAPFKRGGYAREVALTRMELAAMPVARARSLVRGTGGALGRDVKIELTMARHALQETCRTFENGRWPPLLNIGAFNLAVVELASGRIDAYLATLRLMDSKFLAREDVKCAVGLMTWIAVVAGGVPEATRVPPKLPKAEALTCSGLVEAQRELVLRRALHELEAAGDPRLDALIGLARAIGLH